MKKQYDWSVNIPLAYPTTKDHEGMCKMLKGARIVNAKLSKERSETIIITTQEK